MSSTMKTFAVAGALAAALAGAATTASAQEKENALVFPWQVKMTVPQALARLVRPRPRWITKAMLGNMSPLAAA